MASLSRRFCQDLPEVSEGMKHVSGILALIRRLQVPHVRLPDRRCQLGCHSSFADALLGSQASGKLTANQTPDDVASSDWHVAELLEIAGATKISPAIKLQVSAMKSSTAAHRSRVKIRMSEVLSGSKEQEQSKPADMHATVAAARAAMRLNKAGAKVSTPRQVTALSSPLPLSAPPPPFAIGKPRTYLRC